MYRILLIQEKEEINITGISGNVSLSNSVDSLGSSFNFSVARNFYDEDFGVAETIKTGGLIKFMNDDNEVFSGIIVEIEIAKYNKSIKCLDYYFYLNKNKMIKQFNNINASAAIKQMLKEIGAEIGTFENIATSITKIYKNKTVAEIIKDILKKVNDELGKKYILELQGKKFNLIPYKKIQAKAAYDFTGTITVTESIIDMKNSILVISNDQEEESIYYHAKDDANIKKYGMLQEIVEVDPEKDDISKVRNIATTKLKELNKVMTSASISVLGTDELKAGRVLEVINKEFGLNGNYLIKNCNHTYQKGHHITNLELEVI